MCDVQSICNYLEHINGSVEIVNNAPGCNSLQEIEEACYTVTGLDTVQQTVTYKFSSVLEKNAASILIKDTMEKIIASGSLGDKEQEELDKVMNELEYEIIEATEMIIHYPSGWVVECLNRKGVITYLGDYKAEQVTEKHYQLLEVQWE